MLANPLHQDGLVKDQHRVEVLDSLGQLVTQLVQVHIQPLAVEALAYTEEGLKL